MENPHPITLREHGVACVEERHTHRAVAAHFRVVPQFVNNKRVAGNGDITVHELCFELVGRGVSVYPSTVIGHYTVWASAIKSLRMSSCSHLDLP